MRCPRRLLVVRWLPYKQLSTVKGVEYTPRIAWALLWLVWGLLVAGLVALVWGSGL